MFAIISFRAGGPIKTWSDIRGANVHNARIKPIDHAVDGALGPTFLVGSDDLVADVRWHLRSAAIDPDRIRKRGVIAYEAIMSASHAFFEEGDATARASRLQEWTAEQVDFAMKRWGRQRVASMVLHQDEKTPHIHLVVLPIVAKTDGRRKDKEELRHTLVGASISGPGRFDALQDDYAAAMEPFGLARGVRGSGRKNEPMARFMERTEREKHAAQRQRSLLEAERAAIQQQEQELIRSMEFVGQLQREAEDELAIARAEKAEANKLAQAGLADRDAAIRGARELDLQWIALERQKDAVATERRLLKKELAAIADERARLAVAQTKAATFMEAVAHVPERDMQPLIARAVVAAHALRSIAGSTLSQSM